MSKSKKILAGFLISTLSFLNFSEVIALENISENNVEIQKLPPKIPKTGPLNPYEIQKRAGIDIKKSIETKLPERDFRLAGSSNIDFKYWSQVLDENELGKEKYLVLPVQGLVIPINSVSKNDKAYHSFMNGNTEHFLDYLKTGAVELPGTSRRGYGQSGNKVIGGHSSYWKKSDAKYKTHFQKIIALDRGEEIWVYEKTKSGDYKRFVYKTYLSYNTSDDDVSVLAETNIPVLTLFTCTPIGGNSGRWIVKAKFTGN